MLVLEEIGVEILMIAAVLTAATCLIYLLTVTVLEQVYLARLRREHRSAPTAVVIHPLRSDHRPGAGVLRHKRA